MPLWDEDDCAMPKAANAKNSADVANHPADFLLTTKT
jgi:hypothetical protein